MAVAQLPLALSAMGAPGDLAAVRFVARVHGIAPKSWVLHLRRADALDGEARRLPGTGVWDTWLPTGSLWEASLEAPGFWSEPRTLAAQPGTVVYLDAWPVGELVVPLRGAARPEAIMAVFRSVPGVTHGLSGNQPCRLGERTIHCTLPATTLDVSLKIPGFASEPFWGVTVGPAATTLETGRPLRPGASVSGFVDARGGDPAATEVVLVPVEARTTTRLFGGPRRVRANPRGYFQFAGVAPGRYRLAAEAPPDLAGAAGIFTVEERAETELVRPLALAPLASLLVRVLPPLSPSGRGWRVRLAALGATGNVREADADARGEVSFAKVLAGDWTVQVVDPGNGRTVWHERAVRSPEETQVTIELDLVAVEGDVTHRDRPLEAGIRFADPRQAAHVAFAADEEGRFAGYLPTPGRWDVAVMGRREQVFWTGQVDVPRPRAGEPVPIHLRVEGREVRGVVVNQDDSPRGGARVEVEPASGACLPHPGAVTDRDGRFVLAGLPNGNYAVRARDGGRASEPLPLLLSENSQPGELRLVLADACTLRGYVVGELGPLAGAPVEANTLVPLAAPPLSHTDDNGRFQFTLGPGASMVSVVAFPPHGSLAVACTELPREGELVVRSRSLAGSLELIGIVGERGSPPPLVTFHQGCPIHLHTLQRWMRHMGDRFAEEDRWRFHNLPPGRWDVCPWPGWTGQPTGVSGCPGGLLPPGCLLTLSLAP